MFITAVKLALRDFRRGYRGFWIFLSCLALGVGAITAVLVIADGIVVGIERDGKILLGGDLALSTPFRPMSPEQREFLDEQSLAVAEFVEMRTLLRTESLEKNVLVELKAVNESYPIVGDVTLENNAHLNEALTLRGEHWGAVVDSALIESGHVQLNDSITIGETQFVISGVIELEPDRITGSDNFGFWPRVMVNRDALKGSILLSADSRNFWHYRILKQPSLTLDESRQQLEQFFSDDRWELRDTRDAAPDMKSVVQRLAVLISFVGLTTLLIGGVGISNSIRAYLDTRLNTIAILKCVGASRQLVLRIYLVQLLILSTLGILFGIALGYVSQVFVSTLVHAYIQLPIEYSFSLHIMLICASYGFSVALLFSLAPVSRAINVSPGALFRNAVVTLAQKMSLGFGVTALVAATFLMFVVLATAHERRFAVWFIIGAIVAWLTFRAMSAGIMSTARRMNSTRRSSVVRLAISNLYRPSASTSDVVLAIGLGLSVLVAVAIVSSNMDRQINGLIPKNAPEMFFIDIQSYQHDQFLDILENTAGIENVDILPYTRGYITHIKGMNPYDAMVDPDAEWMIDDDRAFTYSTKAPDNATIELGEWWPEDYAGDPLLSIHEDVASSFDLGLGDTITVNILGREIVGTVSNVRSLEWRTMQLNFAIMLSPEPLRHAPHGYIATAEISEQGEFELQNRIAQEFPNITTVRVKDVLQRVSDLMIRGRSAARGVSTIAVIAGILVLCGVVVSENRRRAYEGVLLKTLGAPRRFVFKMFALEYLMQGTVTAIIAVVFGALASWAVMTILMGWEWQFTTASALTTALLGLVVSITVGLLGIWRAMQHRPLAYLRNE